MVMQEVTVSVPEDEFQWGLHTWFRATSICLFFVEINFYATLFITNRIKSSFNGWNYLICNSLLVLFKIIFKETKFQIHVLKIWSYLRVIKLIQFI